MKRSDLESLSIDELWAFREKVGSALAVKLVAEKNRLENRLVELTRQTRAGRTERRSYPPVFPKYRNPKQPSETWAGRGKQPRWLAAELGSGKRLDDFRIGSTAA